MRKRLNGLDALRGLLAVSVVLYHMIEWSELSFSWMSPVVIEVLVANVVACFFMISGFSMFYVYRNKINNLMLLKKFYIKRFFRIAPLFYFLLCLLIGIKLLGSFIGVEFNRPLTLDSLFMNFTFLFGFINPADSLLVSGWSIGVEMVFYIIFPFILIFTSNNIGVIVLWLVTFLIMFFYEKYFLPLETPISILWREYVVVLNHFFYFITGFVLFLIYEIYESKNFTKKIKRVIFFLLVVVLLTLIFFISFTKFFGVERYLIAIMLSALMLIFIQYDVYNNFFLHLGDLSYSIYLGHFFVYTFLSMMIENKLTLILVSFIGIYLMSLFTYKYIELSFIRFGKKYV